MNLLKSLELHPSQVRNGTRYDPFPGPKLMRLFWPVQLRVYTLHSELENQQINTGRSSYDPFLAHGAIKQRPVFGWKNQVKHMLLFDHEHEIILNIIEHFLEYLRFIMSI